MPHALENRLETALAVAQAAGMLALSMAPAPGAAQASLKGRQDWLTAADGAVERLIAERLTARHPQDGFQGEEEGVRRTGSLRWVVDPIDGTSNYARGATRWAVSIGLMDNDTAVLGVLAAPALVETYAACQGAGATLNGTPIHAAATSNLDRAIVEAGWSPRVPAAEYLALSARLMATGVMLRNGGSGALGLADVAVGRIDGYAERHINLWDCCAALAILHESGAVTTPFDPAGGPLLAAAPGVAAALRAVF